MGAVHSSVSSSASDFAPGDGKDHLCQDTKQETISRESTQIRTSSGSRENIKLQLT